MSDDLEDILEELKNDESLTTLNEPQPVEKIDINDDNVNDYIMQKVARLVESGIDVVESIQQTVATGLETDELAAFSSLISSVTHAADVLNKINIQNKKAAATKEIKEMDIEAKKQLSAGNNSNGGTTNVLIATREEIMDSFLEKNKKVLDVTDVEVTEINDDE
jgi:phenylalanyl-tRNA synthetase alpha subunit|tara:strand:+ start:5172 stop:5663 length:492 start_codon:yes stop_codon:yes gene_type:complete